MHAFVSPVLAPPPYLANVIKTQLCSYFLKEAFFSSQPEHHILYHDKTVFQSSKLDSASFLDRLVLFWIPPHRTAQDLEFSVYTLISLFH